MQPRKASIIVGSILATGFVSGVFGQELIDNGAFDSNFDGWMVSSLSSGTMEWSATQGQPPGAVRLVGEDQYVMTTACLHFEPGTFYMTADGFAETAGDGLHCGLNFAMYSMSSDCTGVFSGIPIGGGLDIVPSVQGQNRWESLVMEIPIPDDVSETGVLSFRAAVVKASDFGGDDACIFDNVSLRLVPRPTIPTASTTGLAVLGALLAVAALIVLKRVSS